MSAARRLASFEDLYAAICALPEHLTGEIVNPGEIRTMSRPGFPHRLLARRLGRTLDGIGLDAGGAWWIEEEAEIRFGERLFTPDLAGWKVPDGDVSFARENPILRRPGWACEILSRTTQRGDRLEKLPIYAKAGVGHVWVVDPEIGQVEIYGSSRGRPVLLAAVMRRSPGTPPPFGLPVDIGALLAAPRRAAGNRELFEAALSRVPDVEPDEKDR